MAFKVLIVEDSEPERHTMRRFFERCPPLEPYAVHVIEAADGEEGLARFTENPPDLLMADLLLPRVDGLTLCRKVRALFHGGRCPIIAASGVYRQAQVATQLAAEDIDFLPKPLDFAVLTEKVAAVLDKLREDDPAVVRRWERPVVGQGDPKPASPVSPSAKLPPTQGAELPPVLGESPVPRSSPVIEQPDLSFDKAFKGRFDRLSLGALLLMAARSRATGTLRTQRGRVKKAIFIVGGRPIFVDSNLRSETLGSYLVSRNLLQESDLNAALKEARAQGSKLGATLSSMGFVDPRTIQSGLRAQTRIKIVSALRWEDGAYAFAPGDDFREKVPSFPVDVVPLVLGAKARFASGSDLGAAFDEKLQHRVQLSASGRAHADVIAEAYGSELFTQGLSIAQLQAGVEDGAAALSKVQALLEIKLAHLIAPVPGDVASPLAVAEPEAAPLADDPSASAPTAPDGPRRGEGDGEEISTQKRKSHHSQGMLQLAELEPVSPSVSSSQPGIDVEPGGLPWGDEDSGVIEIGRISGRSDFNAPITELDRDEEEAGLREFFEEGQQHLGESHAPQGSQTGDDEGQAVEEGHPVRKGGAQTEGLVRPARPTVGGPTVGGPTASQPSGGRPNRIRPTGQQIRLEPLIPPPPELGGAALPADAPQGELPFEVPGDPLDRSGPQDADSFGAELHFQQGQGRLRSGDAPGAISAFEQAVAAHPAQPDYHAQLGWAHFLRAGRGDGGAKAARPHLARALEISNHSVRAHELAGRIERDAGALRAAADHFSLALRFGQPRADLFASLKDVLVGLGDFERLDNHYRTIIMRLRDVDPAQTLPYWLELAYLYRDRLDRPHDAALALKVAARLAPDDPLVQAARASIAEADPPWQEVAEGHRRRFVAHPQDPAPLFELYALHREGGRDADLFVVASLLKVIGHAGPEHLSDIQRLRAGFAFLGHRPLPSRIYEALRHPADDPHIEAVLVTLTDAVCDVFPIALEQDCGNAPPQIYFAELPAKPMAEVIEAAAAQLEMPLPAFFRSGSALPMAPMPGREPRVAMSELLLAEEDPRLLMFVAARALSCATAARREVFLRRGGDLRSAVLGALAACRPGFAVRDPDGKISAFCKRLKSDPRALSAVGPLLDRLFADGKPFNLSEWMRGVKRTSARLGLLLCGDVVTALRALDSEADTVADLIDFSLSATYRWASAEWAKAPPE